MGPKEIKNYFVEPLHGQLVPTGEDMVPVLSGLMGRQLDAALGAFQAGKPVDLTPFLEPLFSFFQSYLFSYAINGAAVAASRILGQLRRRNKKSWAGQKRMESVPDIAEAIGIDWTILTRQTRAAAANLSMNLAQSTLARASRNANQAIRNAREQIELGLDRGSSVAQISNELRQIFDPDRALLIAQTESNRAFHTGQVAAAQETGLIGGTEWLASSDACDLCLSFKAKGPVPLGVPYGITGPGPYGTIYHPPGHPSCYCSILEVFKDDMPNAEQQAAQRARVEAERLEHERRERESREAREAHERARREAEARARVINIPTPAPAPVEPTPVPVAQWTPRKPKEVAVNWSSKVDLKTALKALSSRTGEEVTEARLMSLTGTNNLDGASGYRSNVVAFGGDAVRLNVQGNVPGGTFTTQRTYNLNNRSIHNDLFKLSEGAKGGGQAVRMFAEQVTQAISLGFHSIDTYAAGDKNDKNYQGYAVWPRMGYDAPLPDDILTLLRAGMIPEGVPRNAKRLSDLMATQAGRDWWSEHGSWINVDFDLMPGSKSRAMLAAYLRKKGMVEMAEYVGGLGHGGSAKMAKTTPQSPQIQEQGERVEAKDNKREGDQIDLSNEDISLVDQALDQLFGNGV